MIPEYLSDNEHKTVKIYVTGGGTITNNQIVEESMVLKESVVDSDSIEFVGCIASYFQIQVHGVYASLKNKAIRVTIKTDTTEEITIFNGIIDSVELQSNHDYKTITAYDELYTKGNTDVAAWYKSLFSGSSTVTLGALRNSLFNYIGITQEATTLPNDNISIKRQYDPETLQAIVIIKSICQINGVFGIINRSGNFEYRVPTVIGDSDGAFPSAELYPPFYPGRGSGIQPSFISAYQNADYQEFLVKPVDKLTIRDDDEVPGVSFGSGTNNYIIQGNIFTYKLSNATVRKMARNIYDNISTVSFRPFEAENNGFPWLECGKDWISYKLLDFEQSAAQGHYVYSAMEFPVFNREMRGIQHLTDTYNAQGEELQTKFITDINAQIDLLKRKTKQTETDLSNYYDKSETYNKGEVDDMISHLGGWSVQSVSALPANPESSVLYLIQGEVVVN